MMTFFKSEDEARLQRVLALDKADRKRLEKVKNDLEALRPRWTELQVRAEQLAAQSRSSDSTYDREVVEEFWKSRETQLSAELEKTVRERDVLTAGRVAAINELKGQIHRRCSLAAGDFSSWMNVISGQLPQALKNEIEKARGDLAKLTDLGEIFAFGQRWIERIAELDDVPVRPALLNVGSTVRKLAA